ncbi:hypothetical protein MKW94_016022 [Papaver nudicaule]|uniref:RCC1-like domain-containing protein n=1 Tax=Papaver nudicaule TaxID=74823 RepID=A0AA41W1C6_PAPNU|nr:hypothetical protein [Papaver nudicaule]
MEEGERTKVTEEEEEERKSGQVWSWGAGTDGQLGTAKLQDEHLPQLIHSLNHAANRISQLACGGAHVIALTRNDGKVFTWGRGTSGQLGHGDSTNCLNPKPVKLLETLFISHVSAGWNHSGFVSDSGKVYTCGDGSFGQLGHGDYESHNSPVEVSYFDSKHVEQIACGLRHSLVLLKGQPEAQIHGFGSGKRGQLGVSVDRIKRLSNLPQAVKGLENVEILNIYANGDHSAAVSADGHVYTWGKGFSGKSDAYSPQILSSPLKFTKVALGWNHALLLTDAEEVFMLGGKYHGMLSDPGKMRVEMHPPIHESSSQSSDSDKRMSILGKVLELNETKVIDVAAGSEHSAILTENGEIMAWGWGEHGQLGLGNTCDQTGPQMVNLGDVFPSDNQAQLSVYCGSGFTFVVRLHSQI